MSEDSICERDASLNLSSKDRLTEKTVDVLCYAELFVYCFNCRPELIVNIEAGAVLIALSPHHVTLKRLSGTSPSVIQQQA